MHKFIFNIMPVVLLAGWTFFIPAQEKNSVSIHGRVFETSTGNPLGDVNVYLANTMIGTATNKQGHYSINKLPAGRYKLVVSSIGYYHEVKDIEIGKDEELDIDFMLIKKTYELPTVDVVDEKDREWRNNYRTFVREFIGTTDNADDTEIVDPYLINFTTDSNDNLVASVPEPIEIINSAMGYKILYFLEVFEYNNLGSVKYSGYPVFEKMAAPDKETEEEWKEQRYETYRGSFPHFLKTISDKYYLANNPGADLPGNINTEEIEKYTTIMHEIEPWAANAYESSRTVDIVNFLHKGDKENELKLSFPKYLLIDYNESFFQTYSSTLLLHADTVVIDKRGRYHDEFRIQRFGYWAEQRIADMLPLDYDPRADK